MGDLSNALAAAKAKVARLQRESKAASNRIRELEHELHTAIVDKDALLAIQADTLVALEHDTEDVTSLRARVAQLEREKAAARARRGKTAAATAAPAAPTTASPV